MGVKNTRWSGPELSELLRSTEIERENSDSVSSLSLLSLDSELVRGLGLYRQGVGRGEGTGVGTGVGSSVMGERQRYWSALGTSRVMTGPELLANPPAHCTWTCSAPGTVRVSCLTTCGRAFCGVVGVVEGEGCAEESSTSDPCGLDGFDAEGRPEVPKFLNIASRESAEDILCSLLRLCGEDVLEQGDEDDLTVSSLLGGSGVISEEEMSGVSMTSSLPDPLYLCVWRIRGERRGDLLTLPKLKMRLGDLSSAQLTSEEEELISLDIFSRSLAKVTFLSCLEGEGAREVSEVSRMRPSTEVPSTDTSSLRLSSVAMSVLRVRSCVRHTYVH